MYQESNDIIPYKRKMEAIESYIIPIPDAIAGICVQVKGNVDKNKFLDAVKKLRNIYPILNSRVILDEKNEAWFEEINREFFTVIINRESDDTWRNVINSEWKKPFYLDKGPLTRFILVHSDTFSEIIFVGHHVVVDGFGVNKIVNLLLQFMEDLKAKFETVKKEPLPSRENLKKFRPKLTPSEFLKRANDSFILNFVKNQWRISKLRLSGKDFMYSHDSFFKNYNYIWKDEILTEKETFELFKICREKNVTINSVMTVAFLACKQEIDKEHENNKQRICVDLRRHLDKDAQKSLSCYASSIDTNFSYDNSNSFWQNVLNYHKDFIDKMNEYQDVEKVFQLSKLPLDFLKAVTLSQRMNSVPEDYKEEKSFKKLGNKSYHIAAIVARNTMKASPSITITNMGVGRYAKSYGDLTVENCILLPSAAPIPLGVIVASIVINKQLVYTFNSSRYTGDGIKDFDIKFNMLRERFKEFLTTDIFK